MPRARSCRGITSGPRQAAIRSFANGGAGISIASPGVTIGGTTSGAGNAISGNNGGGIVVDTASSNALVQGNTIGPNAALTAVLRVPDRGLVEIADRKQGARELLLRQREQEVGLILGGVDAAPEQVAPRVLVDVTRA